MNLLIRNEGSYFRINDLLLCGLFLVLAGMPVLQLKADDTDINTVFRKLAEQSLNDLQYTEKKYSSFLDDPIIQSGILRYRPPDTVIREQKKPDKMLIEINGNVVNILRKGENKTIKLEGAPTLQVFVDSIRAILSGDLDSIKSQYEIEFFGDVSSWKMKLRPRDRILGGYIDNLTFKGVFGNIKNIEVHEDDENWSEMSLESIKKLDQESRTSSRATMLAFSLYPQHIFLTRNRVHETCL